MRMIALFIIWCGAFAACAAAECDAPRYQYGQVWEESEYTVLMSVSIPLQDFVPPRLICLAEVFRRRYPGRKSITILIFSSRDAAKPYTPTPDGVPKSAKQQRLHGPVFWLSHLHGSYSYDMDKHEEFVDIRPFGSDAEGPNDTRIDLPANARVHLCRLEVSGRCLLALARVNYPELALAGAVSGAVTLSASIGRSGKVTGITVIDNHVIPLEQKDVLVNDALQNLKTWQFESSSKDDHLRITYSYVRDAPTVPKHQHWQVDVRFALPNQIEIHGQMID